MSYYSSRKNSVLVCAKAGSHLHPKPHDNCQQFVRYVWKMGRFDRETEVRRAQGREGGGFRRWKHSLCVSVYLGGKEVARVQIMP